MAYIKTLKEKLGELEHQLSQETEEIKRWLTENEILVKKGQLQFQENKLIGLQAAEAAAGQQQQPTVQQQQQIGQQQLPVAQQQLPIAQQQLPVAQQQLPVVQQQLPVAQQQQPANHAEQPTGQQVTKTIVSCNQVDHGPKDSSYNIGFMNPRDAPGEIPSLKQNRRRVVYRQETFTTIQQVTQTSVSYSQVGHGSKDISCNIGFMNPLEAPGEIPSLKQNRRVVYRPGTSYNTAIYHRGGDRVILQSGPGKLPQPLPERSEEEQQSSGRGRGRSHIFNRLGTVQQPAEQPVAENSTVFTRLGPVQQVTQEEESMDVLQVDIDEKDRID